MKRLAVIAAVLLALVVTASAIIEAYGEATSPKAPTSTLSGTPLTVRAAASGTPIEVGAYGLASGVPTQARTAVVGALVAAQRLRGVASFYCLPPRYTRCTKGYPAGSMVAAAGSELRSQGWRGSWVTVTRGDRSVVVQLVDWCGCPGSRVIDLYGEPFSQLANPSAGVIDVTVAVGGPTLPPTSTAP